MTERGIDVSGEFPKPWTDATVRAADVVISMGCGDACPIFPGKRYETWDDLDDPAAANLASVRIIRDDIERRVRALLDSIQYRPNRERPMRTLAGQRMFVVDSSPPSSATASDRIR